jgi:hydroxymethylpyrimidine pyrophosphatase-like HAD family hydrolase
MVSDRKNTLELLIEKNIYFIFVTGRRQVDELPGGL